MHNPKLAHHCICRHFWKAFLKADHHFTWLRQYIIFIRKRWSFISGLPGTELRNKEMLCRWSLVFDRASLIKFFPQILMSLRSLQCHPFEVGFTTWLNWLGQTVGLPFLRRGGINWKTKTWLCEVLIKGEDRTHVVACLCFTSKHPIIIRGSGDKGNYITSTSRGQQADINEYIRT